MTPCPECNRHVLHDVVCPFCGSPVGHRAAAALPSGVGRAALIAFAAVAACHDEPKQTVPDPSTSTSASATATATVTAATSVAATATASATASAMASASTTATVAAAPDAGVKKDSGVAAVPATTNWRNIAKPYGAPPARDRRRTAV